MWSSWLQALLHPPLFSSSWKLPRCIFKWEYLADRSIELSIWEMKASRHLTNEYAINMTIKEWRLSRQEYNELPITWIMPIVLRLLVLFLIHLWHRQMKKNRNYFLQKLSCGISRIKGDHSIEKLRAPRVAGIDMLHREKHQSVDIIYDEMMPGSLEMEDLFSIELLPDSKCLSLHQFQFN